MLPKLLHGTVHLSVSMIFASSPAFCTHSSSLYSSLYPFSHAFFYLNPTSNKNEWKLQMEKCIYQTQGLSSATLEQPTRVPHELDQQPTRASQACMNLVQEQSNLRGVNLVVCQGGSVFWFSSSLQCFFTVCTQTWSLQMKTLLKRLMHK